MSALLHFRFLPKLAHLPHSSFNSRRTISNCVEKSGRGNMKRTELTTSNGDVLERCKEYAANRVVDENINSDCIVGIGSGSTMTYVLNRIVERCKEKSLSIKCIPTSFQSKQLIYDYQLPLTEIDCYPVIDVTIDGADEVDGNLVAIKGGGACLAQEKVVAAAANRFVVVADYRKDSQHLGDNWKKGIPIEVLPMACQSVRHQISRMFDVPIEDLVLRIGKEKAGPVITDNGNLILDWKYEFKSSRSEMSAHWKSLADNVKLIPGVLETGIFANMIKEAYFGHPDGSVTTRRAK